MNKQAIKKFKNEYHQLISVGRFRLVTLHVNIANVYALLS